MFVIGACSASLQSPLRVVSRYMFESQGINPSVQIKFSCETAFSLTQTIQLKNTSNLLGSSCASVRVSKTLLLHNSA